MNAQRDDFQGDSRIDQQASRQDMLPLSLALVHLTCRKRRRKRSHQNDQNAILQLGMRAGAFMASYHPKTSHTYYLLTRYMFSNGEQLPAFL